MSPREPDSRAARTVEAVAVAIADPDQPGKVLIVRRPPDDAELPDLWGLPAASLRPGESQHDAIRRAARDKLGVELDIGEELARGSMRRGHTLIAMRLFSARIRAGTPSVPQRVAGVTQYTDWRWDGLDALRPAAARGSLCCRLALEDR